MRDGLAQANTLRSNNIGENGYGIVYADQVSGHKTVSTISDLYNIHDWSLSASGNNTGDDAIGQLWYVVNDNDSKKGSFYQLINWENRRNSNGWQKFSIEGVDFSQYAKTSYVNSALDLKLDKQVAEDEYLKIQESIDDDDINSLWK